MPIDKMNFSGTELFAEHMLQYNESDNKLLNVSLLGSMLPLPFAGVVEEFIYTKVIPVVCAFGIGGNLLNLIILSQKSLVCTMKRMEKSAHYGLIALAVSDLFVCLTAMSSVFGKKNGGFAHSSFDFRLMHKLYSNGVINTFMLSSTWLTVTTAVSRYIAICHPLKARQIIGKTFTVTSLVAVILVTVLFNVPRFLREEPYSIANDKTGGHRMYFVFPGPLRRHPAAERAYSWTYFTLGIAIPLCVLVFSNAKLAVALRSSKNLRAETSLRQPASLHTNADNEQTGDHSASRRITLTLIVIIAFFVLLFVPAELLNFFMEHAAVDVFHTDVFNMAQAVGNLLQTVNFAVNFILYCIVNRHFRHTIYRLAPSTCCCRHSLLTADSTNALRIPDHPNDHRGMIVAGTENIYLSERYMRSPSMMAASSF